MANIFEKNKLIHGSLFTGIGGFEYGAEMSEIETVWNCEYDEWNRGILKQRFPNSKQYTDVRGLTGLEKVDIISGGFPCQDISIANVSNKKIQINGQAPGINGERSGLWAEMWRIIGEVRPGYVIIENSPMLVVRGLERVITDLARIGYCFEWQCLFASQFGYNHRRKRLYGIAYTEQKRCDNNTAIFTELQKVLLKRTPRQNNLSVPIERINSRTNFELLRMDDGFPKELDKKRIEALGNAVIPDIAHYLFECIKAREKKLSKKNDYAQS